MSDTSSRHRKKDRSKKKSRQNEIPNDMQYCNAPGSSNNPDGYSLYENDTGIGISKVAAEMVSNTASFFSAQFEAIGELPSLAVAKANQGISLATSGLSFQQIDLRTIILGAVKSAMELRRGVFPTITSPKPDHSNSLDADVNSIGIDEGSDESDTERKPPSQASRSSSVYGDILGGNRNSGFFRQSQFETSAVNEASYKQSSELQAALDLLQLLKDPLELPPTPYLLKLEKEVAKIRLVAVDRGIAQGNDILAQITEKMNRLETQKSSLLSQIDEIGSSKELIKERITAIDAEISELENNANNDVNSSTLSPCAFQIEPKVEKELEKIEEIPSCNENVSSVDVSLHNQRRPTDQEGIDSKKLPSRLVTNEIKENPLIPFQDWKAHDLTVTCLFQDLKGPILASASEGEIKLWEVDNITGLFSIGTTLASTQGTIHCLKIVDGILATGGNDQVHIWNTRSLSLASPLPVDEHCDAEPSISSITSPNPPLNSASSSPSVAPHPAIILKGHKGLIRCLDMDEDSVISGSMDGTMRHWDIESGKLINSFNPLWTMNNSILNDHRVKYWDALAGRGPHFEGLGSTVGALQFLGRRLSSGTADGIIRLWDTRTGQPHRSLVGHTGPVTALQFNDTNLVSGSLDHTVKVNHSYMVF
ncbi:Mitochondrial fission protein, variant 3 [Entomophthora muscae]|uniref:Mitochondrial fission protein, variant 3 n=1 Tax=Entomophthora muscae TaxID=34485 RepID=A0ACC2SNA1_9FUNG|nr:Mitochondrial fission protein, variant 3 [Entomophthora muscae]